MDKDLYSRTHHDLSSGTNHDLSNTTNQQWSITTHHDLQNNVMGLSSGYTPTHMTNNFMMQAPPAPTNNNLFLNHYNMQA